MRKQEAGQAVCFTPGQGLSASDLPRERKAQPVRQAPFFPGSPFTLMPPMALCHLLSVLRV